jgi:hypothetical protein
VLEQWTREVLLEAGLGERMERQGLIHAGGSTSASTAAATTSL